MIPMCTVIHVKHKQEYGRDLMDVCDKEQSEAIRGLTGRITVTNKDICYLRQLGFNVIDLDDQLKEMFK